MTKIKFELKRKSSKAVQKKLFQLMETIGGGKGGPARIRRVNKQVSRWLLRWVNDNFKTQGGKVSAGGWKKLKAGGRWVDAGAGWLRWDPSAKILQDSGILKASFISFHNRHLAGVGSDVPYSIYHEAGVSSRGLPQRRMLPIGRDKSVTDGILKIYNIKLFVTKL